MRQSIDQLFYMEARAWRILVNETNRIRNDRFRADLNANSIVKAERK